MDIEQLDVETTPPLDNTKLYRVKPNPSISDNEAVNQWWAGKIVTLDMLVEDGEMPRIWYISEKDGKDLEMPEEYWAGISVFETDLEEWDNREVMGETE